MVTTNEVINLDHAKYPKEIEGYIDSNHISQPKHSANSQMGVIVNQKGEENIIGN